MDTETLQTSEPTTEEATPSGTKELSGITTAPEVPPSSVESDSTTSTPAEVAAQPEEPTKESGPKADPDRAVQSSTFQLPDSPRVDVSAATVARMMGIASTSDLRVLEGRIDLLTSKVSAILTKVDRSLSMFSSLPTASDIGRLEVQVAAIKAMMKELLDSVGAPVSAEKERGDRELAQEQSKKLRQGIKTNTES